jgi:hypothetical protein
VDVNYFANDSPFESVTTAVGQVPTKMAGVTYRDENRGHDRL